METGTSFLVVWGVKAGTCVSFSHRFKMLHAGRVCTARTNTTGTSYVDKLQKRILYLAGQGFKGCCLGRDNSAVTGWNHSLDPLGPDELDSVDPSLSCSRKPPTMCFRPGLVLNRVFFMLCCMIYCIICTFRVTPAGRAAQHPSFFQ